MARKYKISETCGDWALQIKEPGVPHQLLYFKSQNNAELVKSILEWEDSHSNEAVPYKPTLTPPNEVLTCDGCYYLDRDPAPCAYCIRSKPEGDHYRCPPEGEV